MEELFINIGNSKEKIIITRKRIKNIYLRIDDDGKILISAPKKVSLEKIQSFILSKEKWILKVKSKLNNQITIKESEEFKTGEITYILGVPFKINIIKDIKNKVELDNEKINIFIKERYVDNNEYIKKVYDKWFKDDFSYKLLYNLTTEYFIKMQKYNIPMPMIKIKKTKSKWGACFFKKNTVLYSFYLCKAPIECVRYVVVHELSHFKYQNHSKDFYNFVSLFILDYKKLRTKLNKEYGFIVK